MAKDSSHEEQGSARKVVRREDYTPFPWQIDDFRLSFEIGRKITTVRAEIAVRNPDAQRSSCEIVLQGECLELVRVALDGRELTAGEYSVDADEMVIFSCPQQCLISTEVRIRPQENTALDGLYPSGNFLLTQCEAEGFRKITYFPDRPDVTERAVHRILNDAHVALPDGTHSKSAVPLYLSVPASVGFIALLGIAVLTVGLSARAGAFLILPMLALWIGWIFREKRYFALKWAVYALVLIVALYLLVNSLYSRLLGIPPGFSFGNFSYALYGQVKGGAGWHTAIADLGTRDPMTVYRAAWDFFLKHPLSLVIGSAKSYRDFFWYGERSVFEFSGQDWQASFKYRFMAGAALIALERRHSDVKRDPRKFQLPAPGRFYRDLSFHPLSSGLWRSP